MESFQLTKYSISSMMFLVLSITVFYYTFKNSSERAGKYLSFLFLGISLLYLGDFFFVTFYSPKSPFLFLFTYLSLFGIACLPQFAYHFSGTLFAKEAKLFFIISVIGGIGVYGNGLYFLTRSENLFYSFELHNFTSKKPISASIYVFVMIFWSGVVFIRKYLYNNKNENKGVLTKIWILWVKPNNFENRMVRGYLFFVLIVIGLPIVYGAKSVDLLSFELYRFFLDVFSLAAFVFFYILYISNYIIASKLWVRLAWISILVTCSISMVFSGYVFDAKIDHYVEQRKTEIKFIKNLNDFKNIPENILYIAEKDKQTSQLYKLVSFNGQKSRNAKDLNSLNQLQILKRDPIDYRANNQVFFVVFTFENQGRYYEIGYDYLEFRRIIHENTFFLFVIASAILVFIFFIFPFVFRGKDSKYRKSSLEKIDRNQIENSIYQKMFKEKVYCDEDLNLTNLAQMLQITPHQLSEYLNQQLKKSFPNFVNEYRIQEAKEILIADKELDILSVAYSVGFKSKSPFNSTFKKITGMTPNQYRMSVK